MTSWEFHAGHLIDIRDAGFDVDRNSMVPRVEFRTEVTYQIRGVERFEQILVSHLMGNVVMRSREGTAKFVGTLIPTSPLYRIRPAIPYGVTFFSNLDHYTIGEIEKARESRDLDFTFQIFGIIEYPAGIGSSKIDFGIAIPFRLSKSDWVERILPGLKAKDVAFVEIPKLQSTKLTEAIGYLNEAWKEQSMGVYDNTLTKCRKALESTSEAIKGMGFKKTVKDDKGEEKSVPNWEKVLSHKDVAEIFSDIFQKEFGFTAPGAHAGKAINREDGEFALLVTHALVNFVVRKAKLA